MPAPAPEAVRAELVRVTNAAAADLAAATQQAAPPQRLSTALAVMPLIVPTYYDAAGALAVSWYDEIRDASHPSKHYAATIVGTPVTDWIEREVADLQKSLERDLAALQKSIEADVEAGTQRLLDEAARLMEKEVARGFRASVVGNAHDDEEAVGWSRIARPGACKLCTMLAARGAVYREATAHFAAHTDCHCAARPAFRNGEHGPEASVEQYLASSKRRTPAQRARLREYLNQHYPDAPG